MFLPVLRETLKDQGDKIVHFAFAAEMMNVNLMKQYEVYEMHLFEDFTKCIKELGYLPEVSLDNTKKLLKLVKDPEERIK